MISYASARFDPLLGPVQRDRFGWLLVYLSARWVRHWESRPRRSGAGNRDKGRRAGSLPLSTRTCLMR